MTRGFDTSLWTNERMDTRKKNEKINIYTYIW